MSLLRGETDDYRLNLFIQQTLNFDTELNDEITYDIQENENSELAIIRNYNDVPSEKFTVGASNSTFNNNLIVKGVNNVYGSLDVTGTSTFYNDINILGSLNYSSGLNVTGTANIDNLNVTGNTNLQSLNVTGNTDIDGTLDVKNFLTGTTVELVNSPPSYHKITHNGSTIYDNNVVDLFIDDGTLVVLPLADSSPPSLNSWDIIMEYNTPIGIDNISIGDFITASYITGFIDTKVIVKAYPTKDSTSFTEIFNGIKPSSSTSITLNNFDPNQTYGKIIITIENPSIDTTDHSLSSVYLTERVIEDNIINGNLNVTGNTQLKSLNVTGNTQLQSLNVTGNTQLQSLNVTGNTDIDGDLIVNGNISTNNHFIGLDVDATDNTKFTGFYTTYDKGPGKRYAGLYRSSTNDYFYVFDDKNTVPDGDIDPIFGANGGVFGKLAMGETTIGSGGITCLGPISSTGNLNMNSNEIINSNDITLIQNGSIYWDNKATYINGSGSNNIIRFNTNVQERMTIENTNTTIKNNLVVDNNLTVDTDTLFVNSSNGTVGIGTNNPNPFAFHGADDTTLHIHNDASNRGSGVRCSVDNDINGGLIIGVDNSNTPRIKSLSGNDTIFETNTIETVRIKGNGNVGIGTNNPSEKLTVNGNFNINQTGNVGLRFLENSGVCYFQTGTIGTQSSSADLFFGNINNDTNGSSRKIIFKANGNVGIGTTNPSQNLDVVGNTRIRGTLLVGDSSDTTRYLSCLDSDQTGIKFLTFGRSDSAGNQAEIGFDYIGNNNNNNKLILGFHSNQIMHILKSGNVGIGTNNPSQKLEVNGDGIINNIKIGDIGYGSRYSGIANINYVGNNGYMLVQDRDTGDVNINRPTGQVIQFRENNANQITIASGGNVGIGTTVPIAKLDVNTGESTNKIALQLRAGDADSQSDSNQIIFSWNGNPYNANGYAHSIRTRHNSGGDFNNAIDFWLWNTTDTLNSNSLGNRRVMTIEGTGNVGIGTSDPIAKLDIISSGGANPATNGLIVQNKNNSANQDSIITIRVAGSSAGNPFVAFDIGNETGYAIGIDNADNSLKISNSWASLTTNTRFTINPSGAVGIGTTNPGYPLDVVGNIKAGQSNILSMVIGNMGHAEWPGIAHKNFATAGGYALIQNAYHGRVYINRPNGEQIDFRENNNQQMVIKSGGNVGIGTDNPGKKLDVNGTFNVSGNSGFSGNICSYAGERNGSASGTVAYAYGNGSSVLGLGILQPASGRIIAMSYKSTGSASFNVTLRIYKNNVGYSSAELTVPNGASSSVITSTTLTFNAGDYLQAVLLSGVTGGSSICTFWVKYD